LGANRLRIGVRQCDLAWQRGPAPRDDEEAIHRPAGIGTGDDLDGRLLRAEYDRELRRAPRPSAGRHFWQLRGHVELLRRGLRAVEESREVRPLILLEGGGVGRG